ncbi:MAG: aminotransferase class V-fold PLP-dependent enzyme [Hamadaea sp.]|uniref:kynureninase n=1 Tax=Hamadaea sp. TaxID=2024425 RepID=UPI00178D6B3D|nr:aminotransferase class V-fold PLP-dependent enzyme [Hamadaea sp.]NUR71830.1 aminotransferase class V-fold PLP-dependent enzyme [Hamadaea sp.]
MDDLLTRARTLDAADPLAEYRARFFYPDAEPDLIYLDGNSLGRPPLATRDRLRKLLDEEWGTDLVRGWDRWITLARDAGDVLATGVLGVDPGEVLLCDTASVNLYKLAVAACDARPGRSVIITDDDNFPSDQYVLQGVADARGMRLEVIKTDLDLGVTADQVRAAIAACPAGEVAVISLQHVAYRSGAIADMVAITQAAHDAGAIMLWDLCHAAGAVPTPLRESGADLAIGCTYKHLNGGPGAPGFLYVRRDLQESLRQPIWGWFGQANQFDMGFDYDPVPTVERFLISSTPVMGGYAAWEGAKLTAEAGVDRIAAKGAQLGQYAIELFDEWLAPLGLRLASPRDPAKRGAHVTLHHEAAWQICQAWKHAGVIPDFRTPDRLRIGFAPLYTTFAEVYDAFVRLRTIVDSSSYRDFPLTRSRIT